MIEAGSRAELLIREAEDRLREAASLIPCAFCSDHVEECAHYAMDLADLTQYRDSSSQHPKMAAAMTKVMESAESVGVLAFLYRLLKRIRLNR